MMSATSSEAVEEAAVFGSLLVLLLLRSFGADDVLRDVGGAVLAEVDNLFTELKLLCE